jgi:hypothetical protein
MARVLRIFFGALVVPSFGGLALLFVKMRGAPAGPPPKGVPSDILIVAPSPCSSR